MKHCQIEDQKKVFLAMIFKLKEKQLGGAELQKNIIVVHAQHRDRFCIHKLSGVAQTLYRLHQSVLFHFC